MDKKLKREVTKIFRASTRNAKILTEKPPSLKKKSSLHELIKTKEQAAQLMRDLRLAHIKD
jgi:hypothetical protein